jgi:hypothetical protein
MRLEDALIFTPALTDADHAALDEAHLATASLVRKHMVALSKEWERYRRFHHAFKHGLLVVNPDDVALVEDRGDVVEALVVWMRRKASAHGYGQLEPPYDETANRVVGIGELAIDLISYLVDSRISVFDLIDLKADGSWTPKPFRRAPWLWWFDKNDLKASTRAHISERFGFEFV